MILLSHIFDMIAAFSGVVTSLFRNKDSVSCQNSQALGIRVAKKQNASLNVRFLSNFYALTKYYFVFNCIGQGVGFDSAKRMKSVKPGDKFQIAILGINGPISLAPQNPVFFREAKIEFFR